MAHPFGDLATERFYRTGADPVIPAHLYAQAKRRIDQTVNATSPQDMVFPVTNQLEPVPHHPDQWRITLWPLNGGPAQWYVTFRFRGPCAEDIRIVRANLPGMTPGP